jgi:hypothetical protein
MPIIGSPMTVTIPERCSTTSDTKVSSTRCAIPSFHPTGSATSGEIDVDRAQWLARLLMISTLARSDDWLGSRVPVCNRPRECRRGWQVRTDLIAPP